MKPRSWLFPAIAGTLILGWLGLAHGLLPPWIEEAREGHSLPWLNGVVQALAGNRPAVRVMEAWREFSNAIAIAGVLWIASCRFIWTRLRVGGEGESRDPGRPLAVRSMALALSLISLLFLGFTVRFGVVQDYFHYLSVWREVRLRHDPWFLVRGVFGTYPLNAYGPLFNPLAALTWLHPLLPKLLFSTSYVLLTSWLIGFASRDGRASHRTLLPLLVWFWNPYVWVELTYFGHFEVLVGLTVVAALEERARRRELNAGTWLGLGVLLKYLPVVLVPFLALEDGKRLRWRFLFAAAGVIALGFGTSLLLWGPSTFRPLEFAATRGAYHLSIYRFLRGAYSPLPVAEWSGALGSWAPVILFLALLRTWSWYREHQVATDAAAVLASFVTVLFYQVGFAQYPMVPFVLISWWLLRHRDRLAHRLPLWISVALYFGWLSAFDLVDAHREVGTTRMEEWAGLLNFVLGCLVVIGLVRSAPRRESLHVIMTKC